MQQMANGEWRMAFTAAKLDLDLRPRLSPGPGNWDWDYDCVLEMK